MQTSWSKYFEQKQQERILLNTALMKNTHDMTEAEKIEYRKYARRRQQYDDSEKCKHPRDAKKNTGNPFQDKKKVTENSRVQPYPQIPKKTGTSEIPKTMETSKNKETSKMTETSKNTETKDSKVKASPSPFEPEIRKVFPIYSHGKVCGYFYANENEVPPKKVALTNIGTAIKQTSPNIQQLLKPVQVMQPLKRTTTPQVLGTLTTLVLSNVPSNNVTPVLASTTNSVAHSQTVNTLPLVMKPFHGINTSKPLTMVPILPAPVKMQHLIPATLQTGNIKLQNSNLLCVTASGNNQNKTNIIPTFLQPSACNINSSDTNNKSSSSQSTFVTNENQNGASVLSSSEKRMNESEIPDHMQICKLKYPNEIKMEPESDLCEENLERQTESGIHRKNCFALPDSPPDLQIEIPNEEKTDSPDDKSDDEEENDYGLVISSFYSLSKTNASELGIAFEN